jgi:hypothetical protein
MPQIDVSPQELRSILAALRLLRVAQTKPDLKNLSNEQVIQLGTVVGYGVMTGANSNLIDALTPSAVDALIERIDSSAN